MSIQIIIGLIQDIQLQQYQQYYTQPIYNQQESTQYITSTLRTGLYQREGVEDREGVEVREVREEREEQEEDEQYTDNTSNPNNYIQEKLLSNSIEGNITQNNIINSQEEIGCTTIRSEKQYKKTPSIAKNKYIEKKQIPQNNIKPFENIDIQNNEIFLCLERKNTKNINQDTTVSKNEKYNDNIILLEYSLKNINTNKKKINQIKIPNINNIYKNNKQVNKQYKILCNLKDLEALTCIDDDIIDINTDNKTLIGQNQSQQNNKILENFITIGENELNILKTKRDELQNKCIQLRDDKYTIEQEYNKLQEEKKLLQENIKDIKISIDNIKGTKQEISPSINIVKDTIDDKIVDKNIYKEQNLSLEDPLQLQTLNDTASSIMDMQISPAPKAIALSSQIPIVTAATTIPSIVTSPSTSSSSSSSSSSISPPPPFSLLKSTKTENLHNKAAQDLLYKPHIEEFISDDIIKNSTASSSSNSIEAKSDKYKNAVCVQPVKSEDIK